MLSQKSLQKASVSSVGRPLMSYLSIPVIFEEAGRREERRRRRRGRRRGEGSMTGREGGREGGRGGGEGQAGDNLLGKREKNEKCERWSQRQKITDERWGRGSFKSRSNGRGIREQKGKAGQAALFTGRRCTRSGARTNGRASEIAHVEPARLGRGGGCRGCIEGGGTGRRLEPFSKNWFLDNG